MLAWMSMNFQTYLWRCKYYGGAHVVLVIVIGKGHGDQSSNLKWGCLHFT